MRLITILILLPVISYGQIKKIGRTELPKIYKGDTVYFVTEAWCQTSKSEVMQRAELKNYEKKNEKLHKILKEKEGMKPMVDSLIVEIEKVERQRDSLIIQLNESIGVEASDLQADLALLANKHTQLSLEYSILKKRLRKKRVKSITYISIIAIQTLGILILL